MSEIDASQLLNITAAELDSGDSILVADGPRLRLAPLDEFLAYSETTGIITGGADSSTTLLELTDTPNMIGTPGQVVAVNALATAFEFQDPLVIPPLDLSTSTTNELLNWFTLDAPTNGQVATYDIANSRWRALDLPAALIPPDQNFLQLTDTPIDYVGAAGSVAIVNPAEDALVFVPLPGVIIPVDRVVIRHVVAANGGNGDPQGAFSYETQTLNDKQLDAASICVLAANNTFTLEPGTYNIQFDTRVMMERITGAGTAQLIYSVRLFNVTSGTQVLLGTTGRNFDIGTPGGLAADGAQSSATTTINGQFVVPPGGDSYSIQRFSNVSTINAVVQWGGLDVAAFGPSENLYATLVMERVAL